MDIIDDIVNFFTRLFRSRIDRAQSGAKSRMYNAQVKAKSKVSKAFNDSVDGGVDKARKRASGEREVEQDDPPAGESR